MVDLNKLESLVKIKLTDAEKPCAAEFFEEAVQLFSVLDDINTKDTEPLITVSSLENIMREDIVRQDINRDDLFKDIHEYNDDGYIIVPRILE
ncbi:MAG: Asp-tRNA(Asn)/Glu-tRNA(Gln) amidotransferase subunit GatC [Oscillospiraceae bacterium]|nr:Asp-tRNA(Asn)/Glu-tRNA(Gln) amidotransferase subunit GatC [Oscillospiraceae bacterium]